MATASEIWISRKELKKLQREVENYLRAVDTFRAEGNPPYWRGQ